MIRRVYESVIKWDKWFKVYVATDDHRIREECEKHNIPVVMTADNHSDCLDRAYEAACNVEYADKYIIIQGDEPLFDVRTLNTKLDVGHPVNFYTKAEGDDIYDPNCVKVVVNTNAEAIYFSRHSIPYHDKKTMRGDVRVVIYKQIGVYAFSREELKEYIESDDWTYLENTEGIGLNRFIQKGTKIVMRYTDYDSVSVDTDSDRKRVEEIILG
jgi:3-deoxy-manno-octulosonate cytidylyltransferase (CMP-KDO synthetase)